MIVEWNRLDVTVRNVNLLLKIGRPVQNSNFKIHDLLGINFTARL